MLNNKLSAAVISNISNATLVLTKFIIGIMTGSVSIISEAIHSCMDLVASIIAFIAIRAAGKPPDKEHQFGHGKFEDVSGLIEGVLIFIAAGWIIFEAVHKIIKPGEVEFLSFGIAVMLFSSIVNWFVSSYLYKVAKKTDSIALEADALHLRTDVYTSLGVFGGLIIIQITKIEILDPIVAIMVALLIIHTSWELVFRSYNNLTDCTLPESDITKIQTIISEHYPLFIEFHDLRCRKAGPEQHIDLHLTMNKDTHIEDAHNFCDHLEDDIRKEFPRSKIIIHVEPSPLET